jgi:hypothetical protein
MTVGQDVWAIMVLVSRHYSVIRGVIFWHGELEDVSGGSKKAGRQADIVDVQIKT